MIHEQLSVKERHRLMDKNGWNGFRVHAKLGRILLYLKKQDNFTWKEVAQIIGWTVAYCHAARMAAEREEFRQARYWMPELTPAQFRNWAEN